MDTGRFDAVAKTLAARRSRRAVAAGGGLATAALMGLTGHRPSVAQETLATPDATEDKPVTFLFVQTFAAGTLVPKDGEDGVYTLTLDHGAAQTIYFSDRPERVVGTLPTVRFLDALGFTPADPPNAALVAQTDAGEDVVVLELFNPVYTESFGPDGGVTLTYDVRILADYEGDGLAHLAAQQADAEMPTSFGAASLFIDDCDDQEIYCVWYSPIMGERPKTIASLGTYNFCWSFGDLCCRPCYGGDHDAFARQCNATFPECQNRCGASSSALCW